MVVVTEISVSERAYVAIHEVFSYSRELRIYKAVLADRELAVSTLEVATSLPHRLLTLSV